MAITKTRVLEEVRVVPAKEYDGAMANSNITYVTGTYTYTVDDTEDDELPITTQKSFVIYEEDATDVSSHDELVQDICAAVW